jgi:propanol-preferring alcohol dehydrogenase
MRAAVLNQPRTAGDGTLRIVERGPLTPAAGELLLTVRACAVCRTDLQIADGDLRARRLPIVLGHQVVGVVAALGPAVRGWQQGDRGGCAWLASTCGACKLCVGGRENLCEGARFTGWDRDGGFAGQVLVDAAFALRVPASFADLDAAPLMCGGVIGYRALRVSGVERGETLGLYGFGASASLALQIAVHWGCEVFVCTRSERERERALRMGAAWAGGYDDSPPARLSAAVTFAPSGDVVVSALKALDRGGTVAINAIHLDRVPEFSYDDLWLERSIRSVANFTRQDAAEFLSLAATIPIRTEYDALSLEEANVALDRLRSGDVRGGIVLVP